MNKRNASGEITITGTVNEAGVIITDDGHQYVIADDDMGENLTTVLDKRVKVTGIIEETNGQKVMTVIEYIKLK